MTMPGTLVSGKIAVGASGLYNCEPTCYTAASRHVTDRYGRRVGGKTRFCLNYPAEHSSRNRMATAQAGVAERERQIHAIYNSTSWRLSVPIRWVGTGLLIIRRALALTRWKRPTSTTDVSRRKALSKTE